ncbi:hypothetical protein OZ401_005053 (plasmid) [Candidatus Chlorohelix allophototropha]|uniref:Uncharacterized protein n=1 Tax=Candidatus Chlorohelix allophototropha TaxID=3003348 RepID=A0ABY9BBN0_9CHLR|nr:hypothetical protein OZ401_005053 [Chloroflexota bacterium L227-S17]
MYIQIDFRQFFAPHPTHTCHISPYHHTLFTTLRGDTPQLVACSFCTVTDGARTFPPPNPPCRGDLRSRARL